MGTREKKRAGGTSDRCTPYVESYRGKKNMT